MPPIPKIPESQIEGLAKVLGECGSGTDISRVLENQGIVDDSGESTKWRRLYRVFLNVQNRDGSANRILAFVRSFLDPARFVRRQTTFEEHREELNAVLAFSGLSYGPDGKFRRQKPAQTLDEAERRVETIRAKFRDRRLHPEVLKYCKTELMHENYFHAVFEATKGLAQRIRDLAKVQGDGAALVDHVFSTRQPLLAFNSLRTDTEKSQHRGFAALLKGCFSAVRNPLAHEPKVLWEGEDDAADYLTLVSLLHRKLDDCVPTQRLPAP